MSGDDQFSVVSEVYRSERRSKVLTKLPTNLFTDSEEYLAPQKKEYSQAILIPENPKTMMLQDQVKKLEKRLKSIYEIRERKIALAALDNMGGSKAPENMTRKDKELFEHLVKTLKSFRAGMEPPEISSSKKPAAQLPVLEPEPTIKPDPKKVADKPGEENKPEPMAEVMAIVHVLEDIPSFVGPDHTYDLKKDDMVSLPSQIADLLSSNGKARIVEG